MVSAKQRLTLQQACTLDGASVRRMWVDQDVTVALLASGTCETAIRMDVNVSVARISLSIGVNSLMH